MADASSDVRRRALSNLDLTDSERFRHGFPHELFAILRREAPVCWQAFPDGVPETEDEGFWVLSKHADVQAANREIELLAPATYGALSIWNPALVVPRDIPVRLA